MESWLDPVYDAQGMRAADSWAIEDQGVPSLDLMETAGQAGVDASTGEAEGSAADADITVSFHAAKLGHWIAPGKARTGELRVAPIGIPAGAPSQPAGGVIRDDVLALAPKRRTNSTKFDSGE